MAGNLQVEVDFSGVEGKGKDIKSEADGASLKVLPPWMIKQGMNLTKEQRGEVKQEAKMDGSGSLAAPEYSEDKKFNTENNEKNLQVYAMSCFLSCFEMSLSPHKNKTGKRNLN